VHAATVTYDHSRPTRTTRDDERGRCAPEPAHLAGKILTSRSALEGEHKQVTVLFAELKGSMELLADRDPEEARTATGPGPGAHDRGRAS